MIKWQQTHVELKSNWGSVKILHHFLDVINVPGGRKSKVNRSLYKKICWVNTGCLLATSTLFWFTKHIFLWNLFEEQFPRYSLIPRLLDYLMHQVKKIVTYPSTAENIEYSSTFFHRFTGYGPLHRVSAIFQFTIYGYAIDVVRATGFATASRQILEREVFGRIESGFVFLNDEHGILEKQTINPKYVNNIFYHDSPLFR